VFIVSVITGTSCSFTSNVQCVRLAAGRRALLKCIVTEVVYFSCCF